MAEESSSKQTQARSWFDKLSHILHREPQDREELIELLKDAVERKLIDQHSLDMIEGVMEVSDLQVRDIMVPRSQMVVVDIDASPKEFIPAIKASGHSRFPIIGENKDEVIGLLLAKDLIDHQFQKGPSLLLNVREIMRPVVFVPESKRLDVLLREFRKERNHMAIVVDEYGGVSGLVTIEDVLEEIVGDITDEHDVNEDADIKKYGENTYIVKALTTIEDFNEYFDCELSDEEFDTIGGLLTHELGFLPKIGQVIVLDQFHFKVLHSDKRRVRTLQLSVQK